MNQKRPGTVEQKLLSYLRHCKRIALPRKRFTAYELAKITGYSRQHIDRILKKLLIFGVVDFVVTERKGKAAREWFVVW